MQMMIELLALVAALSVLVVQVGCLIVVVKLARSIDKPGSSREPMLPQSNTNMADKPVMRQPGVVYMDEAHEARIARQRAAEQELEI